MIKRIQASYATSDGQFFTRLADDISGEIRLIGKFASIGIPFKSISNVIEILQTAHNDYMDAIKCQGCGLLTVDPKTERCTLCDADHSATDDPVKESQ